MSLKLSSSVTGPSVVHRHNSQPTPPPGIHSHQPRTEVVGDQLLACRENSKILPSSLPPLLPLSLSPIPAHLNLGPSVHIEDGAVPVASYQSCWREHSSIEQLSWREHTTLCTIHTCNGSYKILPTLGQER